MRLPIEPFRHRKVNRLVKAAEPESVPVGEAVYRTGEPGDTVVLVATGYLSLHADASGSPDGGREPAPGPAVALVLPGEAAGLEALLRADTPRRHTALAGPGLALRRLPARGLRRALRTSETTLDTLLTATLAEERLRTALLAGQPSAADRLGRVLADLATRGKGEEGRIELRIPHRILADLAGIHRSTATTLLNDWLYRDLLEAGEPGWRLPDPEALPGV